MATQTDATAVTTGTQWKILVHLTDPDLYGDPGVTYPIYLDRARYTEEEAKSTAISSILGR